MPPLTAPYSTRHSSKVNSLSLEQRRLCFLKSLLLCRNFSIEYAANFYWCNWPLRGHSLGLHCVREIHFVTLSETLCFSGLIRPKSLHNSLHEAPVAALKHLDDPSCASHQFWAPVSNQLSADSHQVFVHRLVQPLHLPACLVCSNFDLLFCLI